MTGIKIIKQDLSWSLIFNHQVVSTISLSIIKINNGEGFVIRNVVTDPDHRNKGFASLLYEAVFTYIKENNLRLFRGAHIDQTDNFYFKNGISFKPSELESNEYKEECIFS